MLPDPKASADVLREKANQVLPPIDLNAIIRQFPHLVVKEIELDGEGLFVDLASHGSEIYLKRDAGPLRKRFTLAHEIGHLILAESGGHPVGYRKSKKVKNTVEHWCNTFAANLLMPRDDVLRFLRQSKLSGLIEALCSGPQVFRVSHQAFRMRVAEIAPLTAYVLEADKGGYKLKEFFLSNVKDDLRWAECMNSIISPMLEHSETRTRIARTKEATIVAGRSKATARRGEFLVILVPSALATS